MSVVNEAIASLKSTSRISKPIDQIKIYKMLNLIISLGRGYFEPFLSVALGLMWIILILISYWTLVLYELIPMPFYIVVPYCVFSGYFFATVIFYSASFSHRVSTELILDFKCSFKTDLAVHQCTKCERRFLIRKIKSLRPLALNASIAEYTFFKITKDSELNFFFAIINYTLSALLSVQASNRFYVRL